MKSDLMRLCPIERHGESSCGGVYDHPNKPIQYRCPKCGYYWWDEPLP